MAEAIKNNSVTNKKFSYSLDGVDITITLRTDVKKELKAGKEILENIIKDINAELEAK